MFYFISEKKIYVQTKENNDYSSFPNITFLDPSFIIDEASFKLIQDGSIVILDDYAYENKNKQSKIEFLKVINYKLRHSDIVLLIVIHNMYHNTLFTDIINAPHLLLSYSNIGYSVMR
jgi:hypothetical protein